MPKSHRTTHDKKPNKIVRSRENAKRKIEECIQKGEDLLNHQITSRGQLDAVQDDYFTWSAESREILVGLFTSHELPEEFDFGDFFVLTNRPFDLHEEVGKLRDKIRPLS